VAGFVRHLRVPIPILIGLAEIFDYRLFGNSWLVDALLYRIALVGAYLLAMIVSPPSWIGLRVAFVVSLTFLWATVLIHPAVPEIYDILCPFFLLGFICLIQRASHAIGNGRQISICFMAGLMLSMAELVRPFVLYLLPPLIILALAGLRGVGWRPIACFFLPLLLLSGSWHLYIGLAHGELAWTNHSGFNLKRAWPMAPMPALLSEPNDAPLAPHRWANLDTLEHQENSRLVENAVVSYVVNNPLRALTALGGHVIEMLSAPTAVNGHQPQHPILWLYRPLVWCGGLALLLRFMRFVGAARRRPSWIIEGAVNQSAVIAMLSILILGAGERGEEGRLMISVLPFLVIVLAAEADALLRA